MKLKVAMSLVAVLMLLLINHVPAFSQIIWNPSTVETVLTPGTEDWEAAYVSDPYVMYDYDDGIYKMWYRGEGTRTPGSSSFEDAIGYAESTDGLNWTNRQLVHGPMSGYYQTKSPIVFKEGDVFRMWVVDYYEVIAGEWSGYVSYLTSSNGVEWNYEGKVLSAQGIQEPQGDWYNIYSICLLREGSQYTMWYSVQDNIPVEYPSKIWRATSNDGITWENRTLSLPYNTGTWESSVFDPHVVSQEGGGYIMYYTAASQEAGWQLASATSEDGITWSNRSQIGIGGGYPFFFRDVDGTPYLYFSRGTDILRVKGEETQLPIEVALDIKPGSYPNSINPESKGKIPVAILSTVEFDAPQMVNRDSLTFGPTGAEASLAFCNPEGEDVNRDGLLDLVCHFYTQTAAFQCGDTKGILKGETQEPDGTLIEGSDSVRINPRK